MMKWKNQDIIINQKFITVTKINQTIHVRCNICEITIIEDDIGKHISIQEHQLRKKALESNLTNLKREDDYPSKVLKWSQEQSSPTSY